MKTGEGDPIIEALSGMGYEHVRSVPGRGYCGVRRMMFTTGLFVDMDEDGMKSRFCYAGYEEAKAALICWTGEDDPPGMWIKEKPSDRIGPGNPNIKTAVSHA